MRAQGCTAAGRRQPSRGPGNARSIAAPVKIILRLLPARHVEESEQRSLRARLQELEFEHRDLDEVVCRLAEGPAVDQLLLRRLKKRKLLLKDQIARLKSELIPDLDA
ncbi:MAG: DUF465 domain-containing protein [Gammaproteobacteria bacterium]|nr:DUF465 domain-containing protein [Gammaproteobacteria bacterium]